MTPEEIKALRKRLGLTQADLAEMMGFSRKETIADWESGNRKISPDRVKHLELLAASLQNR